MGLLAEIVTMYDAAINVYDLKRFANHPYILSLIYVFRNFC